MQVKETGRSRRTAAEGNWRTLLTGSLFGLSLVLTACGGGGSDSDSAAQETWQAGVFKSADNFANQCENPRSGIDPATGSAYPDRQGSGLDERNFLRSWSNDTYLWYDEITDVDPVNYGTFEYFDLLKTTATTASGNPKDQFHFYMDSAEYNALAQSGVSVDYGATWSVLNASPPRSVVVAYVEPNSPADNAGLSRGVLLVTIDGVDVANGSDTDTLNAGLSPSADGETHSFRIRELNGSERDVSLTATTITSKPVLTVATPASGVGYILFNDHIGTAEKGLKDAVEYLAAQGVSDLVLDLRYNGGGYLGIASQLAYMIAGPTRTSGATFETLTFNDKHTSDNTPVPFLSETDGFSDLPAGQPLPTLNLPRVFVITGSGTCSASESIINSLRGVDVEVIQIGSTTCGKPYGFYPEDNCGTTYFTIQFKGENNKGFGDYPDGFSPQNAVSNVGESVPGCEVGDDFTQALGNPSENRLAAALYYRNNPGSCSYPTALGQYKLNGSAASTSTLSAIDGQVIKPRALQGRIMER